MSVAIADIVKIYTTISHLLIQEETNSKVQADCIETANNLSMEFFRRASMLRRKIVTRNTTFWFSKRSSSGSFL
jgi:hypothetical protein